MFSPLITAPLVLISVAYELPCPVGPGEVTFFSVVVPADCQPVVCAVGNPQDAYVACVDGQSAGLAEAEPAAVGVGVALADADVPCATGLSVPCADGVPPEQPAAASAASATMPRSMTPGRLPRRPGWGAGRRDVVDSVIRFP